MNLVKTVALSVSILVLTSGLLLAGSPVVAGIDATTNQPQVSVESADLSDTQIEAGESVEVTATVRNDGDTGRPYPVMLEVDGEVRDTEPVFVGPDSSETVTFEESFDVAGSYDISVNDVAAGRLTVVDPAEPPEPEFEVSSASVSDETIREGESISITATVENVGGSDGTFEAGLVVDGDTVDSTSITLDGGESGQVSFDRTFGEAGEYAISVGETTAGTVTVLEPASFSVTDAQTGADSVTTGETLSVEATIENQGGVAGDLTVELEIDGSVAASTQVDVAGGGTETVEFAHEFDESGDRSVSVNGEPAGDVSVLAPAEFAVSSASVSDETIQEDESISITATVENVGDAEGTFEGDLEVDGDTVDSTTVTLGPDESESVSFDRTFGEAGEYAISVGETTAGTVTVLEPASFSVTDAQTGADSVTTGESLSMEATVENQGSVAGELTVELEIGGSAVASTQVEVAGGGTETVEFTYEFDEPGERSVSVNDEPAGDVSVLAPAEFAVSGASVSEETILEDESVTVTATVGNVGDLEGTFEGDLEVDGDTVDSTSITLDGGESGQVSFERSFDAGTYDLGVNGVDAGQVDVDQPATFFITDTTLTDTVILENSSVGIEATIENTGDRSGTFETDLLVDGETVERQAVFLAAGDRATVTFEQEFTTAGRYDVRVSETTVGTVTVDQPATLELTSVELDRDRVLQGDPVEVVATVVNSGDRDGEFTVELAVENSTTAEQNLTLGADDSETLRFTETFDEVGEYRLEVNGRTTGTVVVEEPPTFEIVEAEVPFDWAMAGTTTDVWVVVENPSNWTATRQFNVTVDDELVTTEDITLDPGEQAEVRIEFEATGGTVAVNGVDAGVLDTSQLNEADPESNDEDGSLWGVYGILSLLVAAFLVLSRASTRAQSN